jgi:sugar (pentulose or hexulose) kinase
LSHGPGHVFRSVYEATAYGTRHILEDLEAHGFGVRRLFAGGGGAKSRLWVQIHADVLGRPVALPADSEACALGSALVAAVHAGHYPDLDAAALGMVRLAEVVEPRPENRAGYEEGYARYRATYPALRGLMHALAEGKTTQ